jgi:hypothetical protein
MVAALFEAAGETLPDTGNVKIRTPVERDEDNRRVVEEKKVGEGKGRTLKEKARRKQM